MARPARRGVLDTGEPEREVAALHRLVDARPLDLEKLRASVAAQSARDALSDFYVEPAHARRIPRVCLREWRTALGVTTPHELAAGRTLRSEGCGEAECEPGNAERAGSGHGV